MVAKDLPAWKKDCALILSNGSAFVFLRISNEIVPENLLKVREACLIAAVMVFCLIIEGLRIRCWCTFSDLCRHNLF